MTMNCCGVSPNLKTLLFWNHDAQEYWDWRRFVRESIIRDEPIVIKNLPFIQEPA